MDKPITPLVERIMEERKPAVMTKVAEGDDDPVEGAKFTSQVIAPIIAEGDPIGAVILGTKEADIKMTEMELKLAETAAGFLAKQMEQ
jgi:AbrB family transcriptional regulator (stage V sporulation protein T)